MGKGSFHGVLEKKRKSRGGESATGRWTSHGLDPGKGKQRKKKEVGNRQAVMCGYLAIIKEG